MKQSKNEAETAHISEESNIKEEECGKARELTLILAEVVAKLMEYDESLSDASIVFELNRNQLDRVLSDLKGLSGVPRGFKPGDRLIYRTASFTFCLRPDSV